MITRQDIERVLNRELAKEDYDDFVTTMDDARLIVTHYYNPDYNCTTVSIACCDEDCDYDLDFDDDEIGTFPLYTDIKDIFDAEVLKEFGGRILINYSDDD